VDEANDGWLDDMDEVVKILINDPDSYLAKE
jgi:hypothetical protein